MKKRILLNEGQYRLLFENDNQKFIDEVKNLIKSGQLENIETALQMGQWMKAEGIFDVEQYLSAGISKFFNIKIKSRTIQDQVQLLMDLEILNMSMKGLTEMPDLFELLHKLTILYCSNNDLKFLNVSNNIGLIRLDCYSNKLKDLDLSKNITLEQLYCDNNLLKYLNLTENTELEQLHCYNNLLETLDVSNNVNLIRLICNGNPNLSQIIAKKGESLYKENIVKDPHTEIIWV